MTETTQSVESQLAQYENLIAMRDVLMLDLQAKRKQIIPDDIEAELEGLESEYSDKIEMADKMLESLKLTIRQNAEILGKRVDGSQYQVLIQKGSWKIKDVEGLLEFAIKAPDVMKYIEKTKPVAKLQVMRNSK